MTLWDIRKGAGMGATGSSHPFRKKTQALVDRFERIREEQRQITLQELEYTFGVPTGKLEDSEDTLEEIDRFVDEHGLQLVGVDKVLEKFQASRYDRNENREE